MSRRARTGSRAVARIAVEMAARLLLGYFLAGTDKAILLPIALVLPRCSGACHGRGSPKPRSESAWRDEAKDWDQEKGENELKLNIVGGRKGNGVELADMIMKMGKRKRK